MHYVCSDIHGWFSKYKKLLRVIDLQTDDHLYVIGDVIDRGPEPVPLLMDILHRRNVHLLIGNHEHMMLNALRDPSEMGLWYMNGGKVTCEQFEALCVPDQNYIVSRLMEQPLVIPDLIVDGRRYYLAHAAHALYPVKETLLYKDAGAANKHRILWSRELKNPNRQYLGYIYHDLFTAYEEKTTLLIGHNPVGRCSYGIVNKKGYGRISKTGSGHLINLDCGCAARAELGCLRLEDKREYYI